MRAFLYLIAIVTANIVTAKFQPANLFGFIIPYGTWFIGVTFFLRDITQNKYGRNKTYLLIITALVLSAISSHLLGDTISIVIASSISFAIAETTDTEIYTHLHLPMHYRVLYSGLVGGLLDSTIFVVLGLSPIGANFLPWEAVPLAILGQVIIKSILQAVGAFGVKRYATKS